jgi:hypothetical protein
MASKACSAAANRLDITADALPNQRYLSDDGRRRVQNKPQTG